MRTVLRIAAAAIGIIGAVDALIINILVSLFHEVARLAGADFGRSHGFIGLGIFIVALVGAFLVLGLPRVGGVLLLLAGIGFFFVVHWWALLASPQLLVAGVLPFLEGTEAERSLSRGRGGMPLPTS